MTDAIISNQEASHAVRHVSPAGLKVFNPTKWLNSSYVLTEFNQIKVFLFFFLFLIDVDLAEIWQENT